MSDLDWTSSYLDTLSKEVGGLNSGFKKGFALTTALPVWLAEKGAETVASIPETIQTLKEIMYKSPDSFAPEDYETKMLELASTVLGGGLGASSLVKGETGAVLAMNKAQGLEQLARTIKGVADPLETKEKLSFFDKASPLYQSVKDRISQKEFDALESISHISEEGNKKAQFQRTTRGLGIDFLKAESLKDLETSFAHETAHGVNWSSQDPRAQQLYKYTSDARKQAMKYVEAAPDAISFSDMESSIYARYDPEEAFATFVGKEFAETKTPLGEIIDDYLGKFASKHEEYANLPRDKKGFDLGADWNKFFRSIYNDNAAERAIREIQMKEGILL